jgi:lipopolysaccharide export system protein LptC
MAMGRRLIPFLAGGGLGVASLTIISRFDVAVLDVSPSGERGARGFPTGGRIDAERMYRRAVRHSRAVRTLRVAIPLTLVLGSIATIVIATWLDPLRALAKLPVDAQGLVVSGTKITMQQPRLTGYTRDSRPYVVTARTSTQDLLKPDLLALEAIHSVMELQDRSKFDLVAKAGLYDTKNEKLNLHEDIVIITDKYRAFLIEAYIDIRAGHVISERPVEVHMDQGKVNANRMEVFESGAVIRFERGVTMIVNRDAAVAANGPAAATRTR